ncbi:hypothetical protein ES705_25289 [subsurface metagenome]
MKNLIILVFSLIISFSNSQTSNWETINISNWGSIKIPPSMEIQRGVYKKILDEAKKEFSVNADRIVFQQKGLNDFGNYDTYARVIIRTDYATPGNLPKLNDLDFTQNEIDELNSMYKQEIISVCKKMNASLIAWTNIKITILNGYKCLYFNYSRQFIEKPSAFSEFYIFFNYDKQHTLNFEYRIKHKVKWATEFEKCKSSFKFK